MSTPKLYIGPMSKNIVDAVIEFSEETSIPLGFCASRRQIDYKRGYVNNWSTKEFVTYVKEKTSKVLVCRDHGGPGQGQCFDTGYASFLEDAYTMDIIHIDPWKVVNTLDEGIEKTVHYLKFCESLNKNCSYEICTEQAIWEMTPQTLYIFVDELKKKVNSNLFKKIKYLVIQSGTSLNETKNTGRYEEDRLKAMLDVCKEFSFLSKEHNGDYLNSNIVKSKFDLGLDAINIAPEFGVLETMCILDRINKARDKDFIEELFMLCYKSGQWKKWVDKDFDPFLDKQHTIKICGHYIFSTAEFKKLLTFPIFYGIIDDIKTKVKNRIREIIGEPNG